MLALAILSGYQFLYSNFKQNFREGVESIALIKNQDEVVKRKNFELFSWLDANRGDRLANNDLVYTYDRSAADIVFDDGFEISLSEKTLFRVTRQEEVKTIIVREGIMHTELTPKINRVKFELAGKKIDVNSQGAQLQILKGKEKSRITV